MSAYEFRLRNIFARVIVMHNFFSLLFVDKTSGDFLTGLRIGSGIYTKIKTNETEL